MQTHVDLFFADGEYRFALGLAQLHELQVKCKTGLGTLYARVLAGRVPGQVELGHPLYGQYHVDDLVETVRQGLIGGGEGRVNGETVKVTAMRANELVDRYVLADGVPIASIWNLAAAVLSAKIEGYEPAVDAADKKKAPRQRRKTPTAGSTTQPR